MNPQWIVEIEPGSWIAPWSGSPCPTSPHPELAKRYASRRGAEHAIKQWRTRGEFPEARIVEVDTPHAKARNFVTPERVAEIQRLTRNGLPYRDIARRVGVSQKTAARYGQVVEKRKGPTFDGSLRQVVGEHMARHATDEREIAIGRMLAGGRMTNAQIAAAIGRSPPLVAEVSARWTRIFDAEGSIPRPDIAIGRVTDPALLAETIMLGLADVGAMVLICHGGRFAAALPGTRAARQAERAQPCAIVGTYFFAPATRGGYRVEAATRELIEGDIREAMR